ncbi:GGDEF domain-containing protein [Sulfuricurvum sp.]|uniref:sensor domain-containing diguanylate cyclase n=1 Tax=Sulfuricurvum sp. TaxID=2025608 RepID=UPI003564F2B3
MFTIYFIIFGIVIALFGSLIGYKLQMIHVQDRINKNAEEVAFNKKMNTLKPAMYKMDSMVIALATNKTLREYIQKPNNENKENVTNLFFAIAMSDNLIMQARFIDATGQEKIRVDRLKESSTPFVVKDSNLQDKSNRDYFQITSKMAPDHIWHSKLDLNIENGKIEVPFRPTIRIVTPIYNKDKFMGIVIINMLTNKLLESLRTSPVFEHYIIDREGNIIIHPNDKFSWSKYTHNSNQLRTDFPTEVSKILAGVHKGENYYAYPLDDILNNDDDAILVLKPKAEYKYSLIISNIQSALVVIILSIILSIPLAMYASSVPSKLQKALLMSNNELKRFSDIIDKYVISVTTKTNSIITAVSSAFEKVSGYSKEDLIGKKMNIIRHTDTPDEVYTDLWKTIKLNKEWNGELKNKDKSGKAYWLEETIIPIKDENDNLISYISVGIDITAKKELERISIIDQLTGIYNRRKLDECIGNEVQKAKRYQRALTLLMIDIDYFKNVNDTYGHQLGDYALTTVAQILSQNIRTSDLIGRYGGEEFMIICPETSKNGAADIGEKLRQAISDYNFNTLGHLTISIGVAELKTDDTIEALIHKTDNALYMAKERGRDQVVIEG